MVENRRRECSRTGEYVGERIAVEPAMAELPFADLRDDAGKLQGRWYPDVGILEIQRRGVKTCYQLISGGALSET